MNEVINTNKSPAALGPYSQAIKAGNMIFISGQLPIDPVTMELIEGTIQEQTAKCLENLKAILEEAGVTFNDVVKTTIYIKDMDDFTDINEVYATYFTDNKPARACVEVARLPKDARLEIEAIVVV